MEFLLIKEVSVSGSEHRPLKLSPELEAHLLECDKCRTFLPEWVSKMVHWEKRSS